MPQVLASGAFLPLGNQIWASALSIGDTQKHIAGGSQRHGAGSRKSRSNHFNQGYIVGFSARAIRTPVLIGIQYTLICFTSPSLKPGIVPEQVELVVNDSPDIDVNITQIAQAHLV
jgi:hypothetical protein